MSHNYAVLQGYLSPDVGTNTELLYVTVWPSATWLAAQPQQTSPAVGSLASAPGLLAFAADSTAGAASVSNGAPLTFALPAVPVSPDGGVPFLQVRLDMSGWPQTSAGTIDPNSVDAVTLTSESPSGDGSGTRVANTGLLPAP